MDQKTLDIDNHKVGWHTPVDILPRRFDAKLVFTKNNNFAIAFWDIEKDNITWFTYNDRKIVEITHWKNLPEIPEIQKKST
jgi:hypothetical protein